MLPVLESCLGFTAEMLSLITALYILARSCDHLCQCIGNGAFAKLIDTLVSLRKRKADVVSETIESSLRI